MGEYIKKIVKPDGSIKVYSYTKEPSYYYNRKKLDGNVPCVHCIKMINYSNKLRHSKTKKCLEVQKNKNV